MNRFEKIRKDHQLETAQDYVVLIYQLINKKGFARVTDLAKILAVSNVTVSKTLRRLNKLGYVISKPYKNVSLSEEGKDLAESSIKKHQIIYRFLIHIGVPDDIAKIDTEGIEHHISASTLESMTKYLQVVL